MLFVLSHGVQSPGNGWHDIGVIFLGDGVGYQRVEVFFHLYLNGYVRTYGCNKILR